MSGVAGLNAQIYARWCVRGSAHNISQNGTFPLQTTRQQWHETHLGKSLVLVDVVIGRSTADTYIVVVRYCRQIVCLTEDDSS